MLDNFKKQPKRSNARHIDGFVRAPKKDGFRIGSRTTDLGLKRANLRNKSAKPSHTDFPGLKSTLQQPTSQVFSGSEDLLGLGFQPEAPEKSKRHILSRIFKRRRKHKVTKMGWVKRGAILVSVLVVAAGTWLGLKSFLTLRKVFEGDGTTAVALNRNIEPTQVNSEGDGRINILLLGKGGESHPGGELTDTIIIASIDPFDKSAGLLSIPRDLYVKVPGFWSMKLNAAYATSKQKSLDQGADVGSAEKAGIATLRQTIEEHIGVPMHFHAMVDFTAFQQAVDSVGGIEMDIQERLYDRNFLPFVLDIKPGLQTFNGETALYYVRSRYTSPRGDFDRAERQRSVLVGLRNKVLSVGTFANPVRMSQLLDVIGDNVQTNISLEEMRQLYDLGQQIDSANIKSLSFVDDPLLMKTATVGNQSVVVPVAGVTNFDDIRSFARNQLLDGFLKREAATVEVLNGTSTTGLATKRAKELESYGYKISKIGDAPTTNYTNTILYDLTKDSPYTKRYLERRLDLTATEAEPTPDIAQSQADFVIIIGTNEEDR